MYPVSSTVRDLFWAGHRQVVRITFSHSQGTTVLTESDVIQGSLTIDRYSASGSKIEIGSAIAAELNLTLDNFDGRFDDITFEGAELYVLVGIKDWEHPYILVEDALQDSSGNYLRDNLGEQLIGMLETEAPVNWIPCGYFIVDEIPRTLSTVKLKALDRMAKFDRPVNPSQLSFPMTVETLVGRCCSLCDVTLSGALTSLPNRAYSITALPEGDTLTYRTLIQWCAAIMGTCAFIKWDGTLVFQWYTTASITITPAQRYSSDMQEQDITLTGVVFQDKEENEYISGTDSYALNLSGNGLIQDNAQAVVDNLGAVLIGFTYRPYTAEVASSPFLYPLDKITYTDAANTDHTTVVTHATYLMNGSTGIAGTGETAQRNGYASTGALTQQQAAIVDNLRKKVYTDLSEQEQAALHLNETVANSLGLYHTAIVELNGSTSHYYHDESTLADSTIIYTFKAGGFAWTDDWNNGNPVWTYGISRQGNAILNMLTVYKLTADYIHGGVLTLGGLDNINGQLSILDAGGNEVGRMDNTGAQISGNLQMISKSGSVATITDISTVTYSVFDWPYNTIRTYSGVGLSIRYEGSSSSQTSQHVIIPSYPKQVIEASDGEHISYTRWANSNAEYYTQFEKNLRFRMMLFRNTDRKTVWLESSYDGLLFYRWDVGQEMTNDLYMEVQDNKFEVCKTGEYAFSVKSTGATLNGAAVAVVSSSSRRYKHSITDKLNADLDPYKLYDLPVKQFVYNGDHPLQYQDTKGKTLPGFIAEDVAEIYPAAVIRNEDGRVESWDERRIIPGLLALVQEQKKEIENLEARITRLEELIQTK